MRVWMCGDCKFFHCIVPDDGSGSCRRYPPQLVSVQSAGADWQNLLTRWPMVDDITHACGEFCEP